MYLTIVALINPQTDYIKGIWWATTESENFGGFHPEFRCTPALK